MLELRDDFGEPGGQLLGECGQIGLDGTRHLGNERVDSSGHGAHRNKPCPLDGRRKPGTVGVPLAGQRVALMDPQGRIVPDGPGEVVVRGPNVMRGYLNRPEETAATIVDGWLHTGDVGRFDEDGYLILVDRIKDMIIRGGENLYPKEIENALHEHPAVLEAAVVGAPDAVLGEVPVAFVTLYPGAHAAVDDLIAHCGERLAKIKIPTRIDIKDELPRNPIGKLDKPTLRRELAPTG
ncbi:class I adenylate-forming enzyme family protein [Streptomyces sp. NPDC048241]|uniref:class I adenylate-forming enzyme family protein n=1 Tax=Streptomyces sp. NPDC048241 TaxID=3365521 RepID=UPI00371DC650